MPLSLTQFMTDIVTVNPNLSRFKDSSLEPLLTVLQMIAPRGGTIGMPSANQRENLQNVYAQMPYDKQQKYARALQSMKTGLGIVADAIPCNPRLIFKQFQVSTGTYSYLDASGVRQTSAVQPLHYHHVFELLYDSSNGNDRSLQRVSTRESVRFRTLPSGPPFNGLMGNTQTFVQPQGAAGGADACHCPDDHSTIEPSLIAANPRVEGSLVAEQKYQYSIDGVNWVDMEGGQFLIEKGIRKGGPTGWLYYFSKKNWLPGNQRNFLMEVEYAVNAPPPILPATVPKAPADANIQQYAHSFKGTLVPWAYGMSRPG